MPFETRPEFSLPGQSVSIRKINPDNPVDVKRFMTIYNSPEAMKWMADDDDNTPIRYQTAVDFIRLGDGSRGYRLIGIAGLTKVPPRDQNQLQGWVQFYWGADVDQRVSRGGLTNSASTPSYEVSYATLPNSPHGQIASGLRTACTKMLQDSGPTRLITACVDPKNSDSARVLQAAGFEKQAAPVAWDPSQPEILDDFYVLNPEKLKQIITGKH